jgi:hypothetical protein
MALFMNFSIDDEYLDDESFGIQLFIDQETTISKGSTLSVPVTEPE